MRWTLSRVLQAWKPALASIIIKAGRYQTRYQGGEGQHRHQSDITSESWNTTCPWLVFPHSIFRCLIWISFRGDLGRRYRFHYLWRFPTRSIWLVWGICSVAYFFLCTWCWCHYPRRCCNGTDLINEHSKDLLGLCRSYTHYHPLYFTTGWNCKKARPCLWCLQKRQHENINMREERSWLEEEGVSISSTTRQLEGFSQRW